MTSVNGKSGVVTLASADVNAIDKAQAPFYGTVADAVTYPGIDPTGTVDSSAALQQAMNATPDFGTLIIPPGRYLIVTGIGNGNRSVSISGYGATLIKGSNSEPVIKFNGLPDNALAVQGTAPATLSGSGQPQVGFSVSLPESVDWATGDIVKIVADDPIPEGRPGDGVTESRIGDYYVVHSVNGSTAYLIGELLESYQTNPRIARISRATTRIEGLQFETVPTGMSWTGSMLTISGMTRPTVESITVRSSPGPAIVMRGCYGYTVANCSVDNARDNAATSNFGYGVLDNSCAYGHITNFYARKVRHAYTDDTARVAAGSNVTQYGRTRGTIITSSTCHGSTLAAWDTHSHSDGVTFTGCAAYDCFRAFSLRGRNHGVLSGTAVRCTIGVQIDAEDAGSDRSWGHRVDGLYAESITGGVLIADFSTQFATGREERGNSIRNVLTRNCTSQQIKLNAATVSLDNVRLGSAGTNPINRAVIRSINSTFLGTGIDVDWRANTAGNGAVAFEATGGGRFEVEGYSVQWATNGAARINTIVKGDTSTIVLLRSGRLTSSVTPISRDISAETSYVNWISDAQTSAAFERTDRQIQEVATALFYARSADPIVTGIFTTPGTRTLVALYPGTFVGQVIVVVNTPASTKPVIVKHGTNYLTSLPGGADVSIDPGSAIQMVWIGTVWQRFV